MKRPQNVIQPDVKASAGLEEGLEGVAIGPSHADGMMTSLMATGESLIRALAAVADSLGRDAARPLLKVHLDGILDAVQAARTGMEHLDVFDGIAKAAPEAANALLNKVLADGRFQPWESYIVDLDEERVGIHLNDHDWITSLPPGWNAAKDLNLEGCTGIKSLPQGLTVEGDLHLRYCTSLVVLPDNLEVAGTLDMAGCASWDGRLPEGLQVGKGLAFRDCLGLSRLPDGLTVNEFLDLSGCASLETLPNGLTVGRALCLENCTSLVGLPVGLQVGWNLFLEGCTSLKSLPQGLKVGGHLDLAGCTSLVSLPEGLWVDSCLDLRGCTSWDGRFPDDLQVGGKLYTDQYPEGMEAAAVLERSRMKQAVLDALSEFCKG